MRKRRDPKYRHHKARNLAVVRIEGKDYYLGTYESEESIAKYHRLIADWRSGTLTTIECNDDGRLAKDTDITIFELTAKYAEFAKGYYIKNGKPTQPGINVALRYLRNYFGTTKAKDFGPKSLSKLREEMIADNHSRRYINDNIRRIKRCFRWATVEELIPGNVYHALRSLPSLAKGRSEARETPPVVPAEMSIVDATLEYLSTVIADMVRIQLLTATRPSEVCQMNWLEIDRTNSVWLYQPQSHKTQHHAAKRVVFIGPEAREIMLAYLDSTSANLLFSSRRFGRAYTTDGYRQAIRRACVRAGVQIWTPNQLRHARATEIRARFGLEAAQVSLGHASANVTQIYAERNFELTKQIAMDIG